MSIQLIFNIMAGAVVLLAIYLAAYTTILKDSDVDKPSEKDKMYSFSRTQAMWWTTIVAFCFIVGCGAAANHIIALNATCLILLSIGVSTSVVGRVIDSSDKSKGNPRFQDTIGTQGFFNDILMDSEHTNISVHRFQSLIFNVVFGIIFIISFFDSNQIEFPTFSDATLGLLGISSSTYLATKAIAENTKDSSKNLPPKP
jgi:hypothetical protein